MRVGSGDETTDYQEPHFWRSEGQEFVAFLFDLFDALCLSFVYIGRLWKAVGWAVLDRFVVHVDVHGEVML